MKKQIEKIRAAKTWEQRAEIARNEMPGTAFDFVFREAKLAKEVLPLSRQIYEWLGKFFAELIQQGETQTLHDMATALGKWKRHRPKPDYELAALFSMSGMFPPGWTKTWWTGKFHPKTKRPIYGVKPGTRDKIAMRDIKANLARIDPDFSEGKWQSRSRKKIQRYAKEFKIPLDDTPGCPPKK